ncbi:hypothetical protein ACVIHD_003465 [Bradyrhizobium embrapense]
MAVDQNQAVNELKSESLVPAVAEQLMDRPKGRLRRRASASDVLTVCQQRRLH